MPRGSGRSLAAVADTRYGKVRGRVAGDVVVFRGIPFASPPRGAGRFAPPRPPASWSGVREALVPGPAAPQAAAVPPFDELFGSFPSTDEGFLTLDIWAPRAAEPAHPVIVWLHPGGFAGGCGSSSLFDGASFARQGIVFVSPNYRLGLLGYLYLDELFPGARGTGNLGLLDQMAALDWVQENVGSFGGNPGSVTLAGASAGAMSAIALLTMPQAKGLFQRVIAQSGAGHNAIRADVAGRVTRRVLERLSVRGGTGRRCAAFRWTDCWRRSSGSSERRRARREPSSWKSRGGWQWRSSRWSMGRCCSAAPSTPWRRAWLGRSTS